MIFPGIISAAEPLGTDPLTGVKWGAHVSSVPDLNIASCHYDGIIKIYKKTAFEIKTEKTTLTEVAFYFWNEVFMQSKIEFKEEGDADSIISLLIRDLGQPSSSYNRVGYKSYVWESPILYLKLHYSKSSSPSTVIAVSKDIYTKAMEMERIKDRARGLIFDYLKFGYGSFSKYGFDSTTIRRTSDGIVAVDILSITGTEDYAESRFATEFNCAQGEWRTIRSRHEINGKPDRWLSARQENERVTPWRKVPLSVEPVYRAVCNK
jgi:hypothetical protein